MMSAAKQEEELMFQTYLLQVRALPRCLKSSWSSTGNGRK